MVKRSVDDTKTKRHLLQDELELELCRRGGEPLTTAWSRLLEVEVFRYVASCIRSVNSLRTFFCCNCCALSSFLLAFLRAFSSSSCALRFCSLFSCLALFSLLLLL